MYSRLDRFSSPFVHHIFGEPQSKIRRLLIQFSIPLRTRAEGINAARHKLGVHLIGKKRIFTEQWMENLTASIRKSKRVLNAKGTSLKPNGYIEYTQGEHKGRGVHVVAIEQSIGRRLLPIHWGYF